MRVMIKKASRFKYFKYFNSKHLNSRYFIVDHEVYWLI